MVFRVASSSKEYIEIHLEDEDFSLGEILHHELLKDKRVVFAGVVPPHPLLRNVVMKIKTSKAKPSEVVTASSKKAGEQCAEILEIVRSALEQHKVTEVA